MSVSGVWAARDVRLDGSLLMGGSDPASGARALAAVLSSSAGYAVAATWALPRIMMGRRPLRLGLATALLSLAQVAVNSYLGAAALLAAARLGFDPPCQAVHESGGSDASALVTAGHGFFLARYLDMAETAILLLRKKDNLVGL